MSRHVVRATGSGKWCSPLWHWCPRRGACPPNQAASLAAASRGRMKADATTPTAATILVGYCNRNLARRSIFPWVRTTASSRAARTSGNRRTSSRSAVGVFTISVQAVTPEQRSGRSSTTARRRQSSALNGLCHQPVQGRGGREYAASAAIGGQRTRIPSHRLCRQGGGLRTGQYTPLLPGATDDASTGETNARCSNPATASDSKMVGISRSGWRDLQPANGRPTLETLSGGQVGNAWGRGMSRRPSAHRRLRASRRQRLRRRWWR